MSEQMVEISSSYQMLLESAKKVSPRLKERVQEVDQLRMLPQDTISELKAAGLFKILTPKKYGGHQLNFRQYLDIVSELGKGCGSTAWVSSLINVVNWMVATTFTEEVHKIVFGEDGDVNCCGVLEPRNCEVRREPDGVYIKKGLWGFASGSRHADYFFLGIPIVNENGVTEGLGAALLPKKYVKILDDWHTISMRGTGSNSVTVEDVFVPNSWVTSISKAIKGDYPSTHLQNQALYRSAFIPVSALVLMAPGLGLGIAAKEYFIEKLPSRRIQYTWYNKQAEAPVTHLQLAEAVMKIEAASLLTYRAADEIDKWAQKDVYMDFNSRVQVRADCSYANRLVSEAVDIFMSMGGGSVISENNTLSRIMKDAKTPPQHGLIVPTTGLELYGRILAGQESNTLLV
ncbi:acyl-CoA dehydrogenase family protein [Robertmurraya korlensis]|uniref:acyl-CoA dehydrogenase family protein n=1 Tax=Robertmurraya korlensis TaxID=519977 RepID=UPI00203E4EAE|nr:acyl-CoA dehydrogenase family protein [Robertmurraya korlensis]MCM3601718.1 acyl-CoA dehydrogenase family protein [Robertmurraya korlensis]